MQILVVAPQETQLKQFLRHQFQQTNHEVEFKSQFSQSTAAVLVWLPNEDAVDEDVFALVDAIDRRQLAPHKIVMLAVAGINDEVDTAKLKQQLGSNFADKINAFQYATKMLDELEVPYTLIRATKIVADKTPSVITNEGEPVRGDQIGVAGVADLVMIAATTDRYLNQSVGISDN
ncbi:NAD(P)H-binding protein [Paucilactobacillus wasatchensis]|uniref:NAD(P)-binding domain-containing protein n=1 Tax=Paucilactobacillus wasatchensis TaxID=1335616 RepID=A0A0D0YVS6_9LACO|nr:NAD(P)H-binding protein [Paucilactobacillus wasatchensis]KIS03379.1 hypothetical protein WDC_1013 [Paucilactobacillus wasatchensis]